MKIKRCVSLFKRTHLRAMQHHLPYEIRQCCLPPNKVNAPSITQPVYLPKEDGRVS